MKRRYWALVPVFLVAIQSASLASALFPKETYQLGNVSLPQLSQHLNNQLASVLQNSSEQSQETMLKNISLYYQNGAGSTPIFENIMTVADETTRIELVDRWFLAEEKSAVGHEVKNYCEKNLVWRKSIRSTYLPPQSTPQSREAAIHLLLTLKPQGYMDVLERYAKFPDDASQGKRILMRALRNNWDNKQTYSIYKAMSEDKSNAAVRLVANREMSLFLKKL